MKMQDIIRELKRSFLTMMSLLIVVGGIYPLVVWGIAQVVFPGQANGSLLERQGNVVGSSLIAQPFHSPRYFHPRPSAAGELGYDGTSSGGSNLGPLSKTLIDQVAARLQAFRQENDLAADTVIPGDAVTASGSGLDPHISLKNAQLQRARVAKVRGMDSITIQKAIAAATEGPGLGFLGDPGVNVLKLNLALDAMTAASDD